MKSLWTPWNAHSHTHTFHPSLPGSERRKRRLAERERNKTQEAPLSACLYIRSHLSFSLLFLFFLFLSRLPRFRPSQTNRSCQTFDVFISPGRDPALGAELGSRVCAGLRVCQSEFLTSSSDSVVTSVLNAALEKRGSPFPLVHL